MGGRAGIARRSFCRKNSQKLAKSPKVANNAIITDLIIPPWRAETEKNKGKTISPPPKIKKFPPSEIFSRGVFNSETLEGKIKPGRAPASVISFAILTICFVL